MIYQARGEIDTFYYASLSNKKKLFCTDQDSESNKL